MGKKQDTGQGKIKAFFSKKFIWILLSLNALALFLYFSNVSTLLPIRDFPGQVVAALLQAVVTAIITIFLLQAQTKEQAEAEREKERFSVLFKKKSEVYDNFLKKLVCIANKGGMEGNDFRNLQDTLNYELGMYITSESSSKIATLLVTIKNDEQHDVETIKRFVYEIAKVLREDLDAVL